MKLTLRALSLLAIIFVVFAASDVSFASNVTVTAANPDSAAPGTINLNVTISGSGYKRGAAAKFFVSGTTDPGGVTVSTTSFSNSSQVVATINVDASATIASYDIEVQNTDGSNGKGTELFAIQPSPGQCTNVSLQLVVAPQTAGLGGISGDGLSLYNNPNNSSDPFNGGTIYQDGVGGASVKFLTCGNNDFVVNLRGTSPQRYLNLDFSVQLAAPASTAVNFTGHQMHQYGQEINEMANSSLYNASGQFLDCSGLQMYDATYSTGGNWTTRTLTDAYTWFHPATLYDPVVPGCNGGSGPDTANQPVDSSEVMIQQVDACTWTVAPVLDSTGSYYRAGVAEVQKTKGTSSYISGGQFQMPFLYRIQKLNCTP